jgi:hypothetical protein
MAGVGGPWPTMGSSLEGKGRGGTAVGVPWSGGGLQEGAPWGLGPAAPFGLLCSIRERRQEGEVKKEKRNRKRMKKRKNGKNL